MHHIVSLEAGALVAQLRRPRFAHTWQEFDATPQTQVAERLAQASIAVVNKRVLDATLLAGLPKLRLIAVAATGYNNIDVAACRERGIAVCNVPGYARQTVPEHVFALLLALARNIGPFHRSVADGRWQRSAQFCYFDYPIHDLHGRTLGIIGAGTLGQGVVRLATAFGMKVIFGEHKHAESCRAGYVPFAQLLREADIVSLHCPLTAHTRHLIGAAELATMQPHALLINTARGGLVDEAALADALRARRIGGAGFDVLSTEPPSADNPLLAPDLLEAGHFILTPHVAWSSREAMQSLGDTLIDNLEAFVGGEALNRVA